MLKPTLTVEELCDIKGQLHLLKVIEFMPEEVEKELQSLLEREKQTRELRSIQDGVTTSIR